jgi:Ca-activated chloride channel family protein
MMADLCLVLLLDASGSIDEREWALQARATAEALSTTAIVERITRGPRGHVAVMALEFADKSAVVLPWTDIAGMADAQRVSVILATYKRRMWGSTAVGNALLAAGAALKEAPPCLRHVVDLSTDGASNDGPHPAGAVAELQGRGVMVNAVVIEDEPGVLDYYKKVVSGFVVPATWESYAEAIKAKLQLEVAELK